MKNVLYQEIKKELLKDENIYDVSVNSNRGVISIKPVQNKSFLTLGEPLANFENEDGNYLICNTEFKFKNCDHYNTQIYELEIKEI
jgi:hypothetical protein